MKIGITMGDPQGIGPEIIFKALQSPRLQNLADFVVYGDAKVYDFSDLKIPSKLTFEWITQGSPFTEWTQASCGKACIAYLEQAVADASSGKIDALVTAPIAKLHLQKAGYDWPGHTEFLAEKTGGHKVVMMMASPTLKVSLVTIHLPLKEVPQKISEEKIMDTVRISFESLKKYWGLSKPRVAVCGLNPHAGEGGVLGDEEIKIIGPALEKLRQEGYELTGPCVPDAVFHQAYEGQFDAVICMYHDQGLIPFKMLHFRDGVNVTLGLPIIRTSPDHGTGFDIVGKNVADASSMIAAIELAIQMAQKRKVKA